MLQGCAGLYLGAHWCVAGAVLLRLLLNRDGFLWRGFIAVSETREYMGGVWGKMNLRSELAQVLPCP